MIDEDFEIMACLREYNITTNPESQCKKDTLKRYRMVHMLFSHQMPQMDYLRQLVRRVQV